MMADSVTTERRLRKAEWNVRNVDIGIAVRIVEKYHYAHGAANTATYLHGLFPTDSIWNEDCVGIAWWIPPIQAAAVHAFPENPKGVLALSRLAMVPKAPRNACSFLIAASEKLIDKNAWPCLITYADEYMGHKGNIYRAANWEYLGLTQKKAVFIRNSVIGSTKRGPKTMTFAEMKQAGFEIKGRFAKHKFRKVRS